MRCCPSLGLLLVFSFIEIVALIVDIKIKRLGFNLLKNDQNYHLYVMCKSLILLNFHIEKSIPKILQHAILCQFHLYSRNLKNVGNATTAATEESEPLFSSVRYPQALTLFYSIGQDRRPQVASVSKKIHNIGLEKLTIPTAICIAVVFTMLTNNWRGCCLSRRSRQRRNALF